MEYEKCLVQVYEILNHLDEEEILKIPEKVIKNIEEKQDKNFIWKYIETKNILEQELERRTIAILSYINIEYLLTEEERDTVEKMHKVNEEELFPRVGIVNFCTPSNEETIEENNAEVALVEVKEVKWYQKIVNLFRRLIRIK